MRAQIDPWLVAVLLLSVVLNGVELSWGLPNGNLSWAADAIGPITALGVVRRIFGQWNSGWFYFKYPPAWPLLMVAAGAPYLAYLYLTGGWRHPTAEYPYGLADPEHALFVLAMLGRVLNVAFGTATVAVSYGIGRRLIGRAAGRWSAFLVATAYPIIYYAHTTNLDISYCFWLVFALYCAIRASEGTARWPWAALGAAAAMALATKEQGFAFLLPLPLMVLAARARAERSLRACWGAPVWLMIGAGAVTLLAVNNALYNPMGFVGRIAYLLGHPLQPVAARLAPVQFAVWKGAKEWVYVGQLWDGLESSLGMSLLILAGVGALAVWRAPRAATWLLVPLLAQYYLSLRGLDLITLRYLLPVTVIALILVAALLTGLYEGVRSAAARRAVGAAMVAVGALSLARGAELDWLLHTDSRYQAETWMAAHLPPGTRTEVYQKLTFLPRFGAFTPTLVPIEERSLAGLAARRPDVIVTSSASSKSIDHIWTPDWRETGTLLKRHPPAVEFVSALEGQRLPYRLHAVFRQEPRLLRVRITSLTPEIRVYVRAE